MTHTFVELSVSQAAHAEIKDALLQAGYAHAINGNTIDMHGLALVALAQDSASTGMNKKSRFVSGPKICEKSVFVFGPQGCGKTSNAPALARHFGLPHWRDEWQRDQPLPAINHLILTIDDPRLQHGMEHLRRVYSFDEAMAMAGLRK